MVKRNKGDRSKVIINKVDFYILKIIKESKKDVSIMWLNKQLNMSSISFRRNLKRLVESLKFVEKERVPKTNKYVLSLTKDGETIYNILKKVVK